MAQVFHVVRCFSCETFQVQQVKKAKRWNCKVCGEKQSLLKEFGRGSGADCRRHVQKLNATRGAKMEEQDAWSLWKQETKNEEQRDDQVEHTQVSRWSKYLDKREEEEEEEEEFLMGMQHLQPNNRTDRSRSGEGEKHWPTEQSSYRSLKTKRGRGSVIEGPGSTRLHLTNPMSPTTTGPAGPKNIPTTVDRHSSRWHGFLQADSQVQEKVGPFDSGWGQVGRAVSLPHVRQAPPHPQPRPALPGSSMFESGDDFSFDDMFGEGLTT